MIDVTTQTLPILSGEELETWRAYLHATRLLLDELDRRLQEEAGLSLADYGLMSRLDEAGEEGLRMSDLADSTVFSRSRISHAADRLERAGWLRRRSCPTDRRGSYAALTAEGREKLARARPVHAETVDRHLLSVLDEQARTVLRESMESVRSSLGGSAEEPAC